MTMTAARISLEEMLRPEMDAVHALDRAYEAALRTGAADVTEARQAYEAAKRSYRRAERAAFADGFYWTCGRCGGDGIWRGGRPGTCFNCGGSGFHPNQTPHKFEADPRTRLKREAEHQAKRAAERATLDAALETLPGPVAAALRASEDTFQRLNGYYSADEEMSRDEVFCHGLYGKLRKYGSLSVAQVAAVERGLERAAKRAAEAEALKSAPPLAAGKREIEGDVLTTRTQNSQYGTVYKMLVKLDDGNKVWGTIPRAIDYVEIQPGVTRALTTGDRVAFTATVERSADDPHFGFFSRPTKPRIVKAAD